MRWDRWEVSSLARDGKIFFMNVSQKTYDDDHPQVYKSSVRKILFLFSTFEDTVMDTNDETKSRFDSLISTPSSLIWIITVLNWKDERILSGKGRVLLSENIKLLISSCVHHKCSKANKRKICIKIKIYEFYPRFILNAIWIILAIMLLNVYSSASEVKHAIETSNMC